KLSLTGLGLRQPSRRSRPSFRTRGASWGWRDSPFVHPFLNDSRAPRNTQVFSPSHEAWRKHPMLQVSYRSMFPGLGYATAIFATYCAGEWFYLRITGGSKGHH
ncbi:hypothetical protein Ctob_009967, partial [Chrysochromulina tobinii]